MPHCIIEYSENVINAFIIISLLKVIHDTLASSLVFGKKNIKVRAIKYNDYLVSVWIKTLIFQQIFKFVTKFKLKFINKIII